MAESHDTDAPPLAARDNDVAREAAAAQQGETAVVGWSVTINRKPQELYDFWRDFANLAGIMQNVESIEVLDADRSHWKVAAPGGRTVEWDAIVTEDQPGRLIAWKSDEGASVTNSGKVEFKDAGERGSVVSAMIAYDPPGGAIGEFVAKLFQKEPSIQARRDLRRFKQFMETGEIATSARNKAGVGQIS